MEEQEELVRLKKVSHAQGSAGGEAIRTQQGHGTGRGKSPSEWGLLSPNRPHVPQGGCTGPSQGSSPSVRVSVQ